MNKKHMIVFGAAVVAGVYLANAPSGTGIYGTVVGQTFANIYTAGQKLGGKAATATTATTPAVTSPGVAS